RRDRLGRPTKETSATGLVKETSYSYLTTQVTLSGKGVDPQTTITRKDRLGFIRSVTDAGSRTIEYEYNVLGDITKVALPDGNTILTEYDLQGRKVLTRDPSLGELRYAYDGDGLLVLQENGNGDRI